MPSVAPSPLAIMRRRRRPRRQARRARPAGAGALLTGSEMRIRAPCVRPGAGGASSRDSVPPCCSTLFMHDGKAEAGALVALGGDVGLEQTVAVVLGQARSVVDHLDVDAVAVAAHDGLDAAAPVRLLVGVLAPGLQRLLGVLDEIADGLGHEPAVAGDDDRLLADLGLEGDRRSSSSAGRARRRARRRGCRGPPSAAWGCARRPRTRRPCASRRRPGG